MRAWMHWGLSSGLFMIAKHFALVRYLLKVKQKPRNHIELIDKFKLII